MRVAETRIRRRACVRWDGTDDALEALAELLDASPHQTSACPAWCWHLVRDDGRRVAGWWVEGGRPGRLTLTASGLREAVQVMEGDWLIWDDETLTATALTGHEFEDRFEVLP